MVATNSIDVVITWVDGLDKEWLKEKQKYNPSIDVDESAARYRDYGTLKYVLRSIEKFAPWVRNVFLVTNGQIPSWLNAEHPKLCLVKHSDYMPKEYLPTFSSHPIEWCLHRIDGLSENFIYFNDDMLLASPVEPKDFFKNNLPRDILGLGITSPISFFSSIPFNNMLFLNRHFSIKKVFKSNISKFLNLKYGKWTIFNLLFATRKCIYGMYNPHIALALKKSYFDFLWELDPILLDETCKNKFRSKTDVSIWLVRYWQLLTGNFEPRSINFGHYFDLHHFLNDPKSIKAVQRGKYKCICLNDTNAEGFDFFNEQQKLIEIMDGFLGEKSLFEK